METSDPDVIMRVRVMDKINMTLYTQPKGLDLVTPEVH